MAALERRMLRIVKRDIDRLETLQRAQGLGVDESRTIAQHHRTIASIREAQQRGRARGEKHPDRQRGGEEKARRADAKPEAITHRIAREIEERREATQDPGPVSDGPEEREGRGSGDERASASASEGETSTRTKADTEDAGSTTLATHTREHTASSTT